MKIIDHANLIQTLQATSVLVACKVDPERHTVAAQRLQRSIAVLLSELKKDWRDAYTQTVPESSVGIPD